MSTTKRFTTALPAALLVATSLAGGSAFAAPGDLDTAFNSTGYRAATMAGYQGEWQAVKPLPDGRALAAGTGFWNLDVRFAPITGMAAVYKADGTLDTTFGSSGVYVHNAVLGTLGSQFYDAVRLNDGKFLLVGKLDHGGGVNDVLLVRLNANGTRDTTFGTTTPGSVVIPVGADTRARRVALHPDGGFVVVAVGTNNGNVHVLRLNDDGSAVTGFDGDGIRAVTFDVVYVEQTPIGLAVQPDGKILVGSSENGGGGDIAVLRLNTDGSNDTSFDEKVPGAPNRDGKAIYSYGNSQELFFDLLLQPDGKVVVAGATRPTAGDTYRGTLLRANANGTWDAGFNGGSVVTDFPGYAGERFQRVAMQADGSFLVVGNALLGTAYPQYHRQLFAHYSADGVLDTTLGDGGFQTHSIGSCLTTYGAAIDTSGRVYAAGESNGGPVMGDECNGTGNFVVSRYQALPVIDNTPPAVLSATPADAAVAVKRGVNVVATLDEPLDPATVVPGAFTLSCDGAAIAGSLSYVDGANPQVVFDPAEPLPTFRTCTATLVDGGVADLAGNALVGSTSWSFRTVMINRTLSVATRGTGTGTVTGHGVGANSNILSIDCGSKCTTKILAGNQYTLTAVPAPGSRFVKWEGCPVSTGANCEIPAMTRDRTVTAVFAVALP